MLECILMRQIRVCISVFIFLLAVSGWAGDDCDGALEGAFQQQVAELRLNLLEYASYHQFGDKIEGKHYKITLNNSVSGVIFITSNYNPSLGVVLEEYFKLRNINYEELRFFGVTGWFIKADQIL